MLIKELSEKNEICFLWETLQAVLLAQVTMGLEGTDPVNVVRGTYGIDSS